MQAVNEIISILEKFNITKELLETTRLGKHVNELRRKTSDPTLARRAKVLVKRWRDLVIPTVTSPGHGLNRSSAERQMRRVTGTPLTSPALMRQGLSPAVPSPRPPSRPAWGGYESDSQDVILVDYEPSPPASAPRTPDKPTTPSVKRALSPETNDDKKAKRDKKLKKRRGHSRAGSGTETTTPEPGASSLGPQGVLGTSNLGSLGPGNHTWSNRNGSSERRKNGWRREAGDQYAALVNRLPPAGGKKVKTTAELLEQIQSRGSRVSPAPRSPGSPDVMLIEPDECLVKVDSPLRNGDIETAPAAVWPLVPLEEEREWPPCTCDPDGEPDDSCPANLRTTVHPEHVFALHHTFIHNVNGTKAPLLPHKFAVRPATHPDDSNLFSSVVPLYKYSDYADDYCVKNMSEVPLCPHLPVNEFAPSPPSPPPKPPPPSPRPYPIDEPKPPEDNTNEDSETKDIDLKINVDNKMDVDMNVDIDIKAHIDIKTDVNISDIDIKPCLTTSDVEERLKPLPVSEESVQLTAEEPVKEETEQKFSVTCPEHRTVERTKSMDGQKLYDSCVSCIKSIPFSYGQALTAPVLPSDLSNVDCSLISTSETERDSLGRPLREDQFAEWHECAMLGDLIALPYVVID
ncbi:uncharacterized protein LOC126970142 isoform X2 [Leptidea sinapis]|nr:uncharacterized protein LOC126970142 isoform X2 [Leptidea sinapis]